MGSSLKYVETVEDQEFLSTVPLWGHSDYARLCAGYYDARQLFKMAVGGSLSIYDRPIRSMDTCVGLSAC